MFSWFDARDAQQFGNSLAEFFIERTPSDKEGKDGKLTEAHQRVLEKMLQQISIYNTNHKMNLFKKAKLANSFKWKLLDANYSATLVDEITKVLLVNF